MPLKLNPLTAQFDLTGSGGGSSYIDGEVATYNELPLSSTTAPLNTAWLVRGSSGVWPFTKPGGVYIRTATGGSSRDADYTYAGVFPDVFSDANFTIYDDSDTSKNAKFQLSGISTGTTRTISVPNKNVTLDDASDARTPSSHAASHAAGTKAQFSGVISGTGDNFLIQADNIGTAGNSITLSFNGTDNVSIVVAAWNSANPSNQATVIVGDDSLVPNNGTSITLSGGTAAGSDPAFDQNLNTSNSPTFNKLTLTPYQNDSSLKLGTLEFQSYALNNAWIGENVYFDGATFKRRTGGAATLFYFQGEEGQFRCDTSNNAGTGVTSAPAFKVGAGGKFSAGANVSNSGNFEAGMLYSDGNNIGLSDKTDNSKKAIIDVSGITTTTTRTLEIPDASGVIALTSDIPAAFDPASPGTIGATTPAAATFTNLTANTRVNLPNTNGTTAGDLYRNANTLRYRDGTNTERLLLNASDNLANLTSVSTARTNLGLATVAATGAYSDLIGAPSSSGTKTYAVWTAQQNQPPSTGFATLDTRNSIAVLDFDDATTESCIFVGIMPEGASLGSGLIVRIHFMATTATSGNVRWSVSFERGNTDLDTDSFDTATAATTATNGTSGIISVSAITCTAIDGITAGDPFRVRVQRLGADSLDTMTGDAEIVAVELRSAA